MKIFRNRQIVVLSLVLMIVIAGYLQYSYKKNSDSLGLAKDDETKIGEAVYVDNEVASEEEADEVSKKPEKEKPASKQADNFFTQAKLDRETALSRDAETLRAITEDANASDDIKTQAYEKMIKLIDNSQMEMKIENLVADAGFSEALVYFGENGSVDIIVKAPSLTEAQTAKIYDIVSRHANIELDQIYIKQEY